MSESFEDNMVESGVLVAEMLRSLIDDFEAEVKKRPFDSDARAKGAATLMALVRCASSPIPDWALEHIGLRRIPVGDAQTKETHNDDQQTGKKADNPEPPDSGFAA